MIIIITIIFSAYARDFLFCMMAIQLQRDFDVICFDCDCHQLYLLVHIIIMYNKDLNLKRLMVYFVLSSLF